MELPPLEDTITAIATALGVGAVGIVRLSGPDSFQIASKIFKAKKDELSIADLDAGRIVYGNVIDTSAEESQEASLVDEALLLSFRNPHSYTSQDVIELQTHGGPAVLRKTRELCIQHGARLAKPGEFTLRAYLNGRIDLVEAEAVLQMVNAQSDGARRQASLGLNKRLSEAFHAIQSDLTRVYANIHAVIDYPEEGVEESELAQPLNRALEGVEELLGTARAGTLVTKGAKLALIGRPNVGKSSLLNALLGYDRSIVSEQAGTTRDYLEAPLDIAGIPVVAVDTAGIRETQDSIEASGVEASKEIAANADLSLLLLDTSEALTDEDEQLLASLDVDKSIVILNKTDLNQVIELASVNSFNNIAALSVSAKTGAGIDVLKEAIHTKLIGDVASAEIWISSERHVSILGEVAEAIESALVAPDDLAALDIEHALKLMADITGRGEIADEVIAEIFANFCVGK